ncbi:MAG: argininosuccinate lyase [Qingshengfaniella sp.]
MMRIALVLMVLLAGCGIDGAPERPPSPDPQQDRPAPGVTISGDGRTGVVWL